DLIGFQNQCPPPPPKSCNDHPSGTTWFQDSTNTAVEACNTCPDGSAQNCIYKVQDQYRCDDGTTSLTGTTQRGDFVGYQKQSPLPPKSCGEHASGTTWWLDSANTTTRQCDTCADGSARNCIYKVQDQFRCDDGTASGTGQTQLGDFVGYQNQCQPPP